MRPKILVIDSPRDQQRQWEEILGSFLEGGGELFFAPTMQAGKEVFDKELPKLVFIYAPLSDQREIEKWAQKGSRVCEIKEEKQRSLKTDKILEACKEVYPQPFSVSPLPPL